MHYTRLSELPENVKKLPKLAQQIWMRSSNRLARSYSEVQANKVAWSIVKQFYVRKNNKWIKRK